MIFASEMTFTCPFSTVLLTGKLLEVSKLLKSSSCIGPVELQASASNESSKGLIGIGGPVLWLAAPADVHALCKAVLELLMTFDLRGALHLLLT